MASEEDRILRAVRQHLSLVFRVLRRVGLSVEDADEAAQDVFMVLARRTAEVPGPAERAFLVSTALRVASDRRRQQASRPTSALTVELPSPDPAPDELVELRRARAQLDEVLDAITPEQRTVFVLVEMEGFSAPEVASTLGIPLGTVASRLRKARENFDSMVRRLHSLGQQRVG
ncbi:MAG: sigma-70 family RNA polymerase sigma factor [Polyangiaceae bacterium]|nr:sigma-70 family RNA polymerase sigma factor [Polyangiaceae bacterium]